MHVDWNETVAGLSMKSVRDLLRRLRDKPSTGPFLSRTACLRLEESERLINELLGSSVNGEALIAYAKASGKRFRNFVEELTYGDRQVRQLLKNRSPAISLHDIHELDELECDSRIVFSAQGNRDFVAIRTQKKG